MPSDLERKSSASWPKGNFFLLFLRGSSPNSYCLEGPARKMVVGMGMGKEQNKKRSRAEAEKKSGYCVLQCKQHVSKCMIKI